MAAITTLLATGHQQCLAPLPESFKPALNILLIYLSPNTVVEGVDSIIDCIISNGEFAIMGRNKIELVVLFPNLNSNNLSPAFIRYKMLKWAVYGKKTQDTSENEQEESNVRSNKPYDDPIRRSLDAQTVKKSKKPSRYQRRSLGAATRKNNINKVDKENINYIGNTPNYFREGFKKPESNILKDVSNMTPTSITPKFERKKFYAEENEDIPPDLPPTPPTYSRRVREAKKRKLEMTLSNAEVFTRNSIAYKSERRIKNFDHSLTHSKSHSTSEPSLNDLTDRLSSAAGSNNSSLSITKQINNKRTISTTKVVSEGLVEIEYDENLVINCIEKPLDEKNRLEKSTLPIFGHRIFTDCPLYFNKSENEIRNIRSLKRTRKKSNDFESSFKSPSIDKKDIHTLVRDGCSPVSVTPLSIKLAALRFSTMTPRRNIRKTEVLPDSEDIEYFPKVEPFPISLKDEESSAEMETKFILGKDSLNSVSESTVSTTQMGDITLERMIEDIIKSTKIVKSKRRILRNSSHNNIDEDAVPTIELVKDLFVKPQTKTNLIKEAKCISISRENSLSPKTTPTKKMMPKHKISDKLLKNVPIGGFILDDGDGYNEREVKTPENYISKSDQSKTNHIDIPSNLSRSSSMISRSETKNLDETSSKSTPNIYAALHEIRNNRLKRQKCIRRKKSTVSNESLWKQKPETNSLSTAYEEAFPSPATAIEKLSLAEQKSSPLYEINATESKNTSIISNVSHSSLKPFDVFSSHNKRSRELFGLTLENGIPSPITPLPNLKRASNVLSEERAHKTSKLYEEMMPNDVVTPVIEHRSSRRCLTYSPEESINSSEEKRGSVASNRLERSADRFLAMKGTIDLEIFTRNDVIDVHVIRCRDLQRPSGKVDDINAYAKVVIGGMTEQQLPSQRSIFQRTSVLYGKREPEFQRHLTLPRPAIIYDNQTLHISVWHRDKKYRRSEFLGCVSFPLKDAIKSDISGTYFLQQASGRSQSAQTHDSCNRVTEDRNKMATDNTETSTNEGTKESSEKAVANGTAPTQAQVVAALQREADEHLFLRYLELDPPEDPAAPRRAPRNGRTPFTTTRKPPKIERVAAGGVAERAGLRAGDYIVFVGNKNVVTATEDEVRALVQSAGQTLLMETFRRVPQNGVGVRSRMQVTIPSIPDSTPPPAPRSPRTAALASPATAARPPTACSSTSQSIDRRKLHLPQVTFSKEIPGLSTDGRKRALLAVVSREQHYTTCLQFGIVRFVTPLAERADLIVPSDHQLLFQNIEEINRLSEDILDQIVQDEGEIQTSTVIAVKKSKDASGAFSRFCTSPPIPRRRPDITSLIHKPLEQFRELLRLMRAAAAASGSGPYDQLEKKQLQVIVEQLQPFVLSTAGRQWIFGGELSRVEGRTVRPYWALLFSDLLLFATVSRDRVLFVTEEPVALTTVSEAQFNVRKKATEFRLILGRAGGESPLVSCSPRTSARARPIVLRAPSIDLKAVWQSLLQRQISAETQTGGGGGSANEARSSRSKGSTLHLQRWMTQLSEAEELDAPESDMEMWSVEELRKRSRELNLLEVAEIIENNDHKNSTPVEKKENEHSPSKSSNSGSQITVRTSPVVVDTIPVCRQCHKKCLSKPNSPLNSQQDHNLTAALKPVSPQNSISNKSSKSTCSTSNEKRKHTHFQCHLERKGAIRIRPEDCPKAALKVIDSIEQSQRMLKSKSYELKTDSPVLTRSTSDSNTKSQMELRKENSITSPGSTTSSRNSPLSTSHTTCSSMVFNSSSNDLRMSSSNMFNPVQCVIAQEKYINEVKCVENVTLSRKSSNHSSSASVEKEELTRQKAETVLNKVLGINIVARRENVGTRLRTSSVFLDDDSILEDDNDFKIERGLRRSPRMGIAAVSKMNGDVTRKSEGTDDLNDVLSDEDTELGPLMLMGLSAINPAAHLMRVEPFSRTSITNTSEVIPRPNCFGSVQNESLIPNIAVVPPTPDYNTTNKTDDLLDDSPDSPDVPDDLPYISLKRYGTMSSLERMPSDETDDGNIRLTQEPECSKTYATAATSTGGIMGWTARAGSFVVEKMNIFSHTENVPNTSIVHKQPSFLERCLGVSEWKSTLGTDEGTVETGEGSGASGEDAWGTPSSGDLSDNLPDSDHGTLSSPTKSSSSYAGDDDTELMMDELLMAPTITGPTTLRPLLPRDVFRRRLEPLMEEEFSDSGSEDNKATPTNSDDQVMSHIVTGPLVRRLAQDSECGLDADDCCDVSHPPPSASELVSEAVPVESVRIEEDLQEERLTPQAEMRLALDKGKDMLAEQERSSRNETHGDGATGTSGSSDDAFADAISMPEREDFVANESLYRKNKWRKDFGNKSQEDGNLVVPSVKFKCVVIKVF
ncbi:unnamed protein product [Leptidea sinapis]|uniref:PDZ domain-containing protein n=1 Tax=Leptidea sinapis TaxID=189913 RepID=A0A5E4Q4H7_9NEOP|nr:unnamed protein product [Leptidea sinapis]